MTVPKTRTLLLCAFVLWMQASEHPYRPLGTFRALEQCHEQQRQLQLPFVTVCLPATINPNHR